MHRFQSRLLADAALAAPATHWPLHSGLQLRAYAMHSSSNIFMTLISPNTVRRISGPSAPEQMRSARRADEDRSSNTARRSNAVKRILSGALTVLASILVLPGCAGLPKPVSTTGTLPSAGNVATRPLHETIDLSGRLSVRYQRNGNEEAVHGSFTWTQTPQHTAITLLSPLGQTIATIAIAPGHATMTQAGQPPRAAADVDALAADTLGWPLPVAGLRQWLQGYALNTEGQRFVASPEPARATTVTTPDGWQIRYVSWENDTTSGHARPKRIDLQRSTTQAGEVAIRIVIDAWQPR